MRLNILIIIFLSSFGLSAQSSSHINQKADFIVGISRYIRWGDIDKLDNTFRIAVVRDKEMARELNSKFNRRTILGKKVKVLEYYKINEIEECELLYLSSKVFVNDGTLSYINKVLNNYPTLIISDDAKRVAMINFFIRSYDNQLCYEVNKTQIENASLIPQRSLLKHKYTTKIE